MEMIKMADFDEDCLKEKQITKKPGATIIKTEAEKNNKVKLMISNSNYFLKGSEEILNTKTPSIVFIIGFYAMEHRANALIIKNGYEVKDHYCSEIFLSKLGYKELAKQLSYAESQRRNHYNMNLDENTIKRSKESSDKTVKEFIQEIDNIMNS